jgi:formate/nitrite transporter
MNYYTPAEAAEAFRITAINKSKLPFSQFAVMSILGGAFIALGGLLTVMVAGGMPEAGNANPGIVKFVAGALFPVGLIMVSLTGADLFTSDCAGLTFPLLKRDMQAVKVAKILLLSYLFNFIGAQFVAFVLSANAGLFDSEPWKSYLHHYSEAKVNQDFLRVFVKGIGANWLVCLGMLMGYTAKDVAGKCVAIWIPVMIFVTLGYEHSIANMFFIPAAIYSGAGITWGDFLAKSLLPATLGNIAGGMLLVGTVYWYLFLRQEKNRYN